MKFTEKTISQEPMILANDHYVAVPYDCTEIETENGFIAADRLPEAPAAAAAAAMPQITFLPIPEAEADDGENDGDGQTVNPPVAG